MRKTGNKSSRKGIYFYLCAAALAGIILAGTVLARLVSEGGTRGSADISALACSFEILDMSSQTFSNIDYWLESDGSQSAVNTARSVRFVMRNYSSDGGKTAGTDVAGHVRFCTSYEFADGLALQLVGINDDGSYTALTPQYVLADLIYAEDGSFASGSRVFETSSSENYEDRYDGLQSVPEETADVTGGFSGGRGAHTGSIDVKGRESGVELTLTSEVRLTEYSVGFMRTEDRSDGNIEIGDGSSFADMLPQLYIDCERAESVYTIDMTLPEMTFTGDSADERSFVLYVTSIKRLDDDELMSSWGAENAVGGSASDWDGLLEEPQAGSAAATLFGASVTGYRFECELPVCGADGQPTGKTETVRIEKEYDYVGGGAAISFEHIAPPAENAASVAHAINDFYVFDADAGTYVPASAPADAAGAQTLYGTCSNGGTSGYMYFGGVTDNPFYADYSAAESGGERDYAVTEAISKGFSTQLTAAFIQISEAGGK